MRTRVEELFHEVADLSPEARARVFIERDVDAHTRVEVEALLAYDSEATTSIDGEIGRHAQGALSQFELQGLQCGPYKLGDLLGRGGMGTVYLAERVDGEVAQQVAVKLLRPGADDSRFRQRFLSERQILARLSHPNIARLLDAGHREDGQPYLVMEYVAGRTIDVYADGLSLRQTIALFLKVCDAVGYLHRNLVVHRDLKPPNILVTEDGEPKLLDFGIAKILDFTSDKTVTGMRMLTPDYASPEQAMGLPVTTATDIYSLGAVLYKLLTKASPHQFEEDLGAMASAISGKITPPGEISKSLKGDLESIVMKALRKEPQERYATIEQFSEDLDNYLGSRPVRARKNDTWYRTRKFLRRYWIPVAAASLAIAGLSTGLAVANHQRAIAQRRFSDVRQLANKLFDIDIEARKVIGNTKTRQLIVDTSLEYLRRLSADARQDPELALEVGHAYLRVARVQGVPVVENLGQMDQAAQNLSKAETFIQAALAAQPDKRIAMLRLAQIAHDRMLLARFNGRPGEAVALAKTSAEWLEKFHPVPGDKAESAFILATYMNVADQHTIGRKFDEALRLSNLGSDLARMFNSRLYVGNFLWVSAEIMRRQGNLPEALKRTRESAAVLETSLGKGDSGPPMNLLLALIYQARILGEANAISMGQPAEAVPLLERSFNMADGFVHGDSKDQMARGRLGMAGITLANLYRETDPKRALNIYDHIFRHMAEIQDNAGFRRFEVSALAGSSYALRKLGRSGDAKQRLDDAFARLRQVKSYPAEKIKPGSEPDVTLCALAAYEADNGNIPLAIEIYKKLLDQILAWEPKPDTYLADAVDLNRIYAALSALYRQAGQIDAASAMEARRLELWRNWDRKLPNNPFVGRQLGAAAQKVALNK